MGNICYHLLQTDYLNEISTYSYILSKLYAKVALDEIY
jgi:hypothetical protein